MCIRLCICDDLEAYFPGKVHGRGRMTSLRESNAVGRTNLLNGWKEISSFLRMGVRTVQRYEEFGLPVRRLAGKQRGSVIAEKSELDAWMTARPVRGLAPQNPVPLRQSPEWAGFRARLSEMKRLRVETERLRDEAVASLESLNRRVLLMQTAGRAIAPQNRQSRQLVPPLPVETVSQWLPDAYNAKPD